MSEIKTTLEAILSYIFQSFFLTLKILLSLFLPIIVSCIILNVLSREQNKRLYYIGGWKALLITSWIGTPVHELSHYLAAVIANHKIIDLRLFKPDKRTGSLGYMTHSYREDNFYQAVIGNTLIAIAPFFGGAAVIYLISSIIFSGFSLFSGNVPEIHYLNLNNLLDWKSYSLIFTSHVKFFSYLINKIFSPAMLMNWRLYMFLFLMFGIANHLSPSGSDFQNFWQPVMFLITTLLFLSLIINPLMKNAETIVNTVSGYIFYFVPILYLAILVSALWLLVTYVIYLLIKIFRP